MHRMSGRPVRVGLWLGVLAILFVTAVTAGGRVDGVTPAAGLSPGAGLHTSEGGAVPCTAVYPNNSC